LASSSRLSTNPQLPADSLYGTTPDGLRCEALPLEFDLLLEVYLRRCLQVEMPAQLQEIFRYHRLTARHGGVLAQLSAGQSISVTELARRMGVSLSTAGELVGDLGRAGLVERREDPNDRRRTLAALAPTHRATVHAFVAQRAGPLQVLEALSPRDRQGFARGLAAWAQQVRDW
jgi:DNA-binding MarR family transcriptional regulator